ncbi:Serine/threonine-protein kinase SRPK [Psilocybe cubensis]|uniref:non-specific serine/threonine protein kinase n=2 Tax=Psilocybe cubensis TaxID=181762 RepID=A0A8H7XU85_PSICU|nr:Serine/threonine-protein kinase SRPK [Psilocybe cubensis]KAH9474487.1 Serine/threonine-protein kinase SRPK [Psilocybe cubensis]
MSQFPEEPLSESAADGSGYFPAFPGLKLGENRYEVIRKLGYGPRSSVWLALDAQDDRYIALKILTVHATNQANYELEVLKMIQRRGLDDLPSLQCHFIQNSAHGEHLCIGLAVLGTSLEDLRLSSPTKTLPVHIVQKAVASIMVPLLELHKLSLIHGAVTGDNIRFFIGNNKGDIESRLAQLPPCKIEKVVAINGVEYPVVRSQPITHGYDWNETQSSFVNCSLYLSNVGHGIIMLYTKCYNYVALRPPETIIETSYDSKVDIWMLGCAVYQLLTGDPLVLPEKTEDEGDHLAWIQAMVQDRFKRELAIRSPVRECFFAEDGFFIEDIPEDTLESRFASSGMPNITPDQTRGAVQFLERCLVLDPADRPTIAELKSHPWLRPGFACSCVFRSIPPLLADHPLQPLSKMDLRPQLQALPTELLDEIVISIPLHSAPSTILSLILTSRVFYTNLYPRHLYSRVILRDERRTSQAITNIFENPNLGRHVKGIHILYNPTREPKCPLNVTDGVEGLITLGLLPSLQSFTFHAQAGWNGYGQNVYGGFSQNFFGNIIKKCPLLSEFVLSGPEDSFFTPLAYDLGMSVLKDSKTLKTLGLDFCNTTLGTTSGFDIVAGNGRLLSFTLNSLSLSFGSCSKLPCISPILRLHFPNLKRLTLASFCLSDTAEAMSFWRRHPTLQTLSLPSDNPGQPLFSNDINQGFLPNLVHLEADLNEVAALAPIIHQLTRLCVRRSIAKEFPILLQRVFPDGQSRIRSLEIEGALKRSQIPNPLAFSDYILSIAKIIPALEEFGLTCRNLSMQLFFESLLEDRVQGLQLMRRLYIGYRDYHVHSEESRGRYLALVTNLSAQKWESLDSVTDISNRYDYPYTVANVVRNEEGKATWVEVGKGNGMQIGYENSPFGSIPGSG